MADKITSILTEIQECLSATTAALAPFATLPVGEVLIRDKEVKHKERTPEQGTEKQLGNILQ